VFRGVTMWPSHKLYIRDAKSGWISCTLEPSSDCIVKSVIKLVHFTDFACAMSILKNKRGNVVETNYIYILF